MHALSLQRNSGFRSYAKIEKESKEDLSCSKCGYYEENSMDRACPNCDIEWQLEKDYNKLLTKKSELDTQIKEIEDKLAMWSYDG